MRNERRHARRSSAGFLGVLVLGALLLSLARAPHGPSAEPSAEPSTRPTGGLPAAPSSGPVTPEATGRILEKLRSLPFAFEPNRGQAAWTADFISRGRGSRLARVALSKAGADLGLGPCGTGRGFSIRLAGANPNPEPEARGLEALPGKVHDAIGDRPERWITGVPTYAKVLYRGVYPGTDLVWYGKDGRLEFDFVLAPGADPGAIALRYEGVRGLAVDERGDLRIETAGGAEVRQQRPFAYQLGPQGAPEEVDSGYVISAEGEVSFLVARYDASRPLTIDPCIVYSTYYDDGDIGVNQVAQGSAVDATGRAYVVGTTSCGEESQVFLFRLNPAGTQLEYELFLGGSGQDEGLGVAVDPAAFTAYITGFSTSNDFPKMNPLDPLAVPSSPEGLEDVFVAVVGPGGMITHSTLLGGLGDDRAHGIAVDGDGAIYVTGFGHASYPATTQIGACGQDDALAFVAKLVTTAGEVTLAYSLVIDHCGKDAGNAIVAQDCNAFVAGVFRESGAFALKTSCDGDAIVYDISFATASEANGIAVDPLGQAYVTGVRFEGEAVGPGCSPHPAPGAAAAFVMKLDPGGGIDYLTYLGGEDGETVGRAIAVDALGRAIVTGHTTSATFPLETPIQDALAGTSDAFVTRLDPDGCTLSYSTYLGGPDVFSDGCVAPPCLGEPSVAVAEAADTELVIVVPQIQMLEIGFGVAVDADGSAYVAGVTPSVEFPTTLSAPQPEFGGGCTDAFAVKIADLADLEIVKTDSPDPVETGDGTELTYCITVTNHGPCEATGVVLTDVLPSGVQFVSSSCGGEPECEGGDCVYTCDLGDLDVNASATVDICVTVDPCAGEVCNEASVAGNESEPAQDPHPNTATVCTTVEDTTPPEFLGSLVAANHLAGYWPFEGDGADASGNGRDLVIAGGAGFEEGFSGQALSLTGDNAKFATRPGDDPVFDFGTNDFTIHLLANFNTTQGEQVLMEKFQGGGGPGWTLTKLGDDSVAFIANSSSAGVVDVRLPPGAVSAGTWHRFIVRRSGPLFELILGAVSASQTTAEAVPDTFFPLLVGKRNAADGRPFAVNGRIDEVAIWTGVALGAADLENGVRQAGCPEDIEVASDPGTCSAVVEYAVSATDDCSEVSIVCDPPSGSEFPQGETMVTCTATDGDENSAECSFQVTVTGDGTGVPLAAVCGLCPVPCADGGSGAGSGLFRVNVRSEGGCGAVSVEARILCGEGKVLAAVTDGQIVKIVALGGLLGGLLGGDGCKVTCDGGLLAFRGRDICLEVVAEDEAGNRDTCTSAPVVPDFKGTPTCGAGPLEVRFRDLSTGPPTTWLWDFGDGETSTEQHPIHTYRARGSYGVTLTIGDGCEDASVSRRCYVTVLGVAEATSISYRRLRGDAFDVAVSVRDERKQPISGAWVSIVLKRALATVGTFRAMTGKDGIATFTCARAAKAGCYTTTVKDIAKPGFSWNGWTPPNALWR